MQRRWESKIVLKLSSTPTSVAQSVMGDNFGSKFYVFYTNFQGSALQSCRKSGRQWKINTKPQKKGNQGQTKQN